MWRILVVDDDFISRKLISEILKEKANCDVAVNGNEAIEAYNLSLKDNTPYDLILLDISMPEVDGIKVLKTIREMETQKGVTLGDGIPIIMVTAYEKPFVESFKEGCDDYILKPIKADVIIKKIEEKLNNR